MMYLEGEKEIFLNIISESKGNLFCGQEFTSN